MIMFRFFSYLICLFLFTFILLSMIGSNVSDMYDLPSSLFVLAGMLLTFVNFKASEVVYGIQDAFSQTIESELLERYRIGKQAWHTLGIYSVLAGSVGTLMGLIQALGNLDDIKTLTVAIAVSLLAICYGLAIRFFIAYPLEVFLDKKLLVLAEG